MGALDDRVCVITGASRGLGAAIATGYAAEGAHVVLAARTTADLEAVADACAQAGAASNTVVPTDITDESQVQALVDRALEVHGRIDVFVANAGTSYANLTDKRYRELASYDLDVVEQLFRVNSIGTWLTLRAALRAMTSGSVITIGSEAGRICYPGAGVYAVTKATVDAMTKIAANEHGPQGVRVNCLSPGGMVDTQLFGPNGMPEHLKAHGYLETDVIVPAAVWLASDASDGVSGALVSAVAFNAGERPEPAAAAGSGH